MPISQETRTKMSETHKKRGTGKWMLGRRLSEETRRRMSESQKGKMPKNIKMIAGWNRGKSPSEQTRRKISEGLKGRKLSEETKRKIGKASEGRKHSEKTKKKSSEVRKGERGSNWKGGITPINKIIRHSIEFRLWREAVFSRDNWTCQKCKQRGSMTLHPHHIQNFAQYPELRFAIDNGITFCQECHKEFHREYGMRNNTKGQIIEFISVK